MLDKRVQHWSDSRIANKCHHHINGVCRMDFREHLASDVWFARRVCEYCGIEQRDQWGPDRFGRAIWQDSINSLENFARLAWAIGEGNGFSGSRQMRLARLGEPQDKVPGQLHAETNAILVLDSRDKSLYDPRNVQRQAVRSLCGSQLLAVFPEVGR
jgi:hypothetical protein